MLGWGRARVGNVCKKYGQNMHLFEDKGTWVRKVILTHINTCKYLPNYRPQTKFRENNVFLHVFVCPREEGMALPTYPLRSDPPPGLNKHGTRQEMTSYSPGTTKAGGTPPTGMLSCTSISPKSLPDPQEVNTKAGFLIIR